MSRRLDFFLISNTLQDNISTIRILSSFVSDHSPVELTLRPINPLPRGAGIWKFNDSFLKQKDFVDKSNELFDQVVADHGNLQPKHLFELIKFKFKVFARNIAMEKSKNNKIEETKLNDKIREFEKNPSEAEQENYNLAKMQLELLSECRIKGQILRSKSNYYEYGKKVANFSKS